MGDARMARDPRLAGAMVLAVLLAAALAGTTFAAAAIEIRPSTVRPGGTVVGEGSGFAANAKITISASVGPLSLEVATTQSDAGGKFRLEVTLPGSVPLGTFRISASDPTGNTASTTVTVAEATAAPPAALPRTGEPVWLLVVVGAVSTAIGILLMRPGRGNWRPRARLRFLASLGLTRPRSE